MITPAVMQETGLGHATIPPRALRYMSDSQNIKTKQSGQKVSLLRFVSKDVSTDKLPKMYCLRITSAALLSSVFGEYKHISRFFGFCFRNFSIFQTIYVKVIALLSSCGTLWWMGWRRFLRWWIRRIRIRRFR